MQFSIDHTIKFKHTNDVITLSNYKFDTKLDLTLPTLKKQVLQVNLTSEMLVHQVELDIEFVSRLRQNVT